MPRGMKNVHPKKAKDNVVVVKVDPLKVPKGHRDMPRGGTHQTEKHPSRAKSKTKWIKENKAYLKSGRLYLFVSW